MKMLQLLLHKQHSNPGLWERARTDIDLIQNLKPGLSRLIILDAPRTERWGPCPGRGINTISGRVPCEVLMWPERIISGMNGEGMGLGVECEDVEENGIKCPCLLEV